MSVDGRALDGAGGAGDDVRPPRSTTTATTVAATKTTTPSQVAIHEASTIGAR